MLPISAVNWPILKLVVNSVGQVNVRGKSIQIGMATLRVTSPSPIWMFWISVTKQEAALVNRARAWEWIYYRGRIPRRNRMSPHVRAGFRSIWSVIHSLRQWSKSINRFDISWCEGHWLAHLARKWIGDDARHVVQVTGHFEFRHIDFLEESRNSFTVAIYPPICTEA